MTVHYVVYATQSNYPPPITPEMHSSHSQVHFANAPRCAGSSGNAIFTVDVSTNPPTYLSTYVTNLGGGPGDITLGPDGNLYLAQSTGGFEHGVGVDTFKHWVCMHAGVGTWGAAPVTSRSVLSATCEWRGAECTLKTLHCFNTPRHVPDHAGGRWHHPHQPDTGPHQLGQHGGRVLHQRAAVRHRELSVPQAGGNGEFLSVFSSCTAPVGTPIAPASSHMQHKTLISTSWLRW